MKEFIEKLIGRLEELKASGNPYDSYWDEAMYRATELVNSTSNKTIDGVIEIVNQLSEEYNNGWIPVSSGRLPEIDGNTSDVVLVCTVDGFQHMAFWCDDKKWRYCESGMIKNTMEWTEIIAWQPLPAPYQPKGE